MAECNVCFRHCKIQEGGYGFCEVRTCKDGVIYPENYGKITSIALDPIEKKPLNRFYPGSRILSVGSYGCNLRCPFCQNHEISWGKQVKITKAESRYVSPEELTEIAVDQQKNGNIGVAFTYNEPLVSYEYVVDTAKLLRAQGLKTVLVSNGMAEVDTMGELFQYVDAMNIDLKGFTDNYYENLLKGNRKMVMDFIEEAAKHCHLELTTLIIPRENDSDEEILSLSEWVSKINPEIPLHISRFFPRFQMTDREATPVERIYHLREVAEKNLKFVYTGNC